MNKCCVEVFNLVLDQTRKELRERLQWETEKVFEKHSLVGRKYYLSDFTIVEKLGRKICKLEFLGAKVKTGKLHELREAVEKALLSPYLPSLRHEIVVNSWRERSE